MADENQTKIKIERPLYEHNQLRQNFRYEKDKKNLIHRLCPGKVSIRKIVTRTIPVLKWLPKYDWKKDFLADLASGYTVAVMHIPQGMAYALLGNVPPVVGIYMAIFPVLVYFFFGTSKHASMGTFSIACLMTGKAVLEHADQSFLETTASGNNDTVTVISVGYTPIQVATAVTFVTSVVQLIMYCLRLGAVTALLSDVLVKSFTCGAAFQIVATQIKDLIGVDMPSFKGNFITVKILKIVFEELNEVNWAAVIISAIAIIVLVINNEILKPIIAKKSSVPIPIELIVVIIGTLCSQYLNLQKVYDLKVIGDIPKGFPQPEFPPLPLLSKIITDGISTSIVSYAITISLMMILAQKGNYEVDANQELLAMGLGNAAGSCFSCMPFCASLSRSMIQEVVGGKTQLVSVISSILLTVTLLWIAPFFEPLPKCVLASVIVVSLKSMLIQVTELIQFWKMSKLDAVVWIATFLSVAFVSMEIALLVGIGLSLTSIILTNFKPYTCLLGSVPNTDIYLDINKYKKAVEIVGIKIFHYCGSLNFVTRTTFRNQLYKLIELNPQKEKILRTKLDKLKIKMAESALNDHKDKMKKLQRKINSEIKCIVLDFSSVSGLDACGAAMLKNEINEFEKLNITLYIAACSDRVYNLLEKCDLVSKEKNSLRVFFSIHDAVETASNTIKFNHHIQTNPVDFTLNEYQP
ncbi:sulfate transporter-like [Diorhabda sublineata]|uniref:sulfate transporter-like n=1 Tax=Diorhabda sublineata TaxID=1163346 RepID=UPI0024E0991A|nr:sulfate transporter-like [Diorhabda sublineata]XP_056632710.1 sulfate transporter-like [Diorhabda sublineata]